MIEQIHLASQYLAAAAISFGEKKDDDSHTNLGWNVGKSQLTTHVFSEYEDQLGLDINSFSIVWIRYNSDEGRIDLDGKSHKEIVQWINDKVKEAGLEGNYQYRFHYELPYSFPNDEYTFTAEEDGLKLYREMMDMGFKVLDDLRLRIKGGSMQRVWPHHFDLGLYATVTEELGIGMGLAIPDDKIGEYYYYISAYNGNEPVETKGFEPLREGEWQTADWKAATLKAQGKSFDKSLSFFEDAISFYLHGG